MASLSTVVQELGTTWRSRRWVGLGGLLLVAALVLVTAGGPVDYLSAPQPTGRASLSTPSASPEPTDLSRSLATRTSGPGTTAPPQEWFVALIQVFIMLVAIGTAYLLFRSAQYMLDFSARNRHRHTAPQPVSVAPLPQVPEGLTGAGAGRRREALVEGEPRNAIVAAWVDLEESAAASRLARRPAETPLEYVARVLATWDVDIAALAELANLYREARFSSHPMGSRERERALRALDQVHQDLDAAAQTAEQPR